MNGTQLTQVIPYTFNGRNGINGNYSTNIQLPNSAVIKNSWTIALTPIVTTGGSVIINVGTAFNPNLFANGISSASLSTVGATSTENTDLRFMDSTLNVLINLSGAGVITSGSFVTYVEYYFPVQKLPNIPYIPSMNSPYNLAITRGFNLQIPSNGAGPYVYPMFKIPQGSGQIVINNIWLINTIITEMPSQETITICCALTDGNTFYPAVSNGNIRTLGSLTNMANSTFTFDGASVSEPYNTPVVGFQLYVNMPNGTIVGPGNPGGAVSATPNNNVTGIGTSLGRQVGISDAPSIVGNSAVVFNNVTVQPNKTTDTYISLFVPNNTGIDLHDFTFDAFCEWNPVEPLSKVISLN